MPTAGQQELIDEITRRLDAAAGVEAVWLAGSLGKGHGDAYSDIDLMVLVTDGAVAEVSAWLTHDLATALSVVLVNSLYGGRVLNMVTADWDRFDLTIVQPEDVQRYDANALTPIFNKSGITPPARPPAAPYRTSPAELSKLVNEFLRVIGLTPVAMGREEYQLALNGVDLLRRMTMDLMLEENGVSPAGRGGALHRNHLLTGEQRDALQALPTIAAERSSLIAGDEALARLFLPRARRLAAEIGMDWPTAFEDATQRHLQKTLGLRLP